MNEMWPVLFGILWMACYIVVLLVSYGARDEIRKLQPELEKLLYRSLSDQFALQLLPLRISVLFKNPVHPEVFSSIRALRVVYSGYLCLAFGFFTSIAWSVFGK